jgi:hypothetical protein
LRSQIPEHQSRHLIHKLSSLFVSQDVRAVQNRRMRQRLYRRHQDESREVEIGDTDLATMRLEIVSKKFVTVSLKSFYVFEPPGAGDLSARTR